MANIFWIASYPKSGNTWVRSFIYNLLHPSDEPAPISALPGFFQGELKRRWYTPHAAGRSLDQLSPEQVFSLRQKVHVDIARSSTGPVFAKTHSPYGSFNQVPLQNAAVMAGAIYVIRNPLDVVISVADHFGRSLDDAIAFLAEANNATPTDEQNMMDFIGSWSLNVATWAAHQNHPQMALVRYEDLLENPVSSFTRVARLIGKGDDPAAIQKAIDFSSFDVLRRQEEERSFSERSPHSKRFFRKGRQHQWKDLLSDEQVSRLVKDHQQQMSRFNYVP